jgi:hypothetical protein
MFERKVTALFAPDGTEGGAPVAPAVPDNSAGQEEPQEPVFDASKVDANDSEALSRLDDAQLAEVQNVKPASPAAEPAQGTPANDTGAGTAAPAGKYAGKYATIDDLSKGVTEIAAKLGYQKEALQAVLDSAKETGEFKSVEALYKKMERQLSEKGAAPAATVADPNAGPDKGTPAADTFSPTDPKVSQAVDQLTVSQLANSPLAQEMSKKGISLPTNMEEFEALKEINPYYAVEFKQAYRDLYANNLKQAEGYFEAAKTVTQSNASVADTDSQAIQKMATEQGFKVSDAELEAVKTAAIANPFNYETRYGHKFLRANAVRDQFLVSVLPQKIAEIKLSGEVNGREQALSDMDKAGHREVRSLGTSRLSTKTRAIQKMPDLNDPDVIASLPDAALNDPDHYFQNFKK